MYEHVTVMRNVVKCRLLMTTRDGYQRPVSLGKLWFRLDRATRSMSYLSWGSACNPTSSGDMSFELLQQGLIVLQVTCPSMKAQDTYEDIFGVGQVSPIWAKANHHPVSVHTSMYWYIPDWYILVCTCMYWHIPLGVDTRCCQSVLVWTGMNWYVPVGTSMNQYVRLHAGMYWYEPLCTGIYL